MSETVETAIFDLLAKAAPGKSISPEEVARAADPEDFKGVYRLRLPGAPNADAPNIDVTGSDATLPEDTSE